MNLLPRLYIISALVLLSFISISCASVSNSTSSGFESSDLKKDIDYNRAKSFLASSLTGLVFNQAQYLSWHDTETVTYRTNTRSGPRYYKVDVKTGLKTEAFNHGLFVEAISKSISDTIKADNLPIQRIEYLTDFKLLYFSLAGRQWVYDTETHEIERQISPVNRPPSSVLSPDLTKAAFIKEHNLWVRDMISGKDTQLTIDGYEYYGYSTNSQGWSRSNIPVIFWSDDASKISTYRLDERGVALIHLLETAENRSKLRSWPYAMPGDTIVPMHERVVIDVEKAEVIFLDTQADHQRTSNCCGLTRGADWADNQFSSDASLLAFVSTSRDYSTVTLKIADTSTGSVREIYSETDEPFFESNLTSRGVPNWRVLFDANEFIWFSRSDEWGHLFLHDLETGELKNQITKGDWNVVDILRLDEESRTIWFTAVGKEENRDVYQEYLYSIGFDGGNLQLLTPEEGNHSVILSPDGQYFINTWSDFTTPPKTVLRNINGDIVADMEVADISDLLATGWQAPEPFVVKARDGETDIYGLLVKPSNFDPNKKYPIINSIYPGPQVGSVGTRNFATVRRGNPNALAELGFVVVLIDAMGTPMRSKSFHTAYYSDMIDNGLPDQVAAMNQLAEQYEWIDIERAGIFGHSGGGYATAAALLTFPDFFKVGVASAGNMDNRGYTYYWGEKFQGQKIALSDSTDSYTNQAIHLLADQLEGKLLISYGTMDSNVHPNTTELFIRELIRHDKDFDLMVFPNRGHGYFSEAYNLRITWEYFVKHLHR